jgi:phage portal protein BeeE
VSETAIIFRLSVQSRRFDKAIRRTRRQIAKAFGVPDRLVGIPTPWWRHLWQKWTRRP